MAIEENLERLRNLRYDINAVNKKEIEMLQKVLFQLLDLYRFLEKDKARLESKGELNLKADELELLDALTKSLELIESQIDNLTTKLILELNAIKYTTYYQYYTAQQTQQQNQQ